MSVEFANKRWENYYHQVVAPFGTRIVDYANAIDSLNVILPGFLCSSDRKIFLLGGVCPREGSDKDFVSFCKSIHPNPEDLHVMIDMNHSPLAWSAKFHPGLTTKSAQALLEVLPFRNESIDTIFLDGTTEYMRNNQLENFIRGARCVLSRNGVVVITRFSRASVGYDLKEHNGTTPQLFPRSLREFRRLTTGLKLAFLSNQGVKQILALVRQDADFPAYRPSKKEWLEDSELRIDTLLEAKQKGFQLPDPISEEE